MDFIDRLAGRTAWPPMANLFKLSNLHPIVQVHLQRVYMTLTLTTILAAVGCILDLQYHVGGILTGLVGLGCLIYLTLTRPSAGNLNKRYGALVLFGFAQGASLGPLVDLAIDFDPSIVLTAFLATTAIFGSFSLAALMTRRRTYLFLGGYLSAAVSCLALMRMSSWMFQGMRGVTYGAELYVGLLVFSGYVLFDTQMIVERASAGDADHVAHALALFVDLVALFVRILVIVLENSRKKDERDRRRKGDRRQ